MEKERIDVPFYLGNDRAMISLGPLSKEKYCTYSCPFCYVNANFSKYTKSTLEDILTWLKKNRNSYDIIYISGDTDSFAPPRTELALRLLEKLVELRVDILFTTRHLFSKKELNKLKKIRYKLARQNNLLYGCVSISQLNHPFIEPKPISSPDKRLYQLGEFKDAGIVAILAMRPFLPIIPYEDYAELIELAESKVNIILGERWYSDTDGILEKKIITNSIVEGYEFIIEKMDFDSNDNVWRVWKNDKLEKMIENKCARLKIPFFMRSKPALQWYKSKTEKEEKV